MTTLFLSKIHQQSFQKKKSDKKEIPPIGSISYSDKEPQFYLKNGSETVTEGK